MDKPTTKMTEQELYTFIHEQICRTRYCYNVPAYGIVLCHRCAYGGDWTASRKLINAKRRLEREFGYDNG